MSAIEQRQLLEVDPAVLMRENPAALIVNKESYGRMEAYFSPEQLDPPQVCRVATFSAEQGEVIRLFVIDGMTRTKFSNDHRDITLPEYPDFHFVPLVVRDVTQSQLHNSMIVLPSERLEGQDALTMLQYLRAVVPPTVEHSQIAPERIAAHLINGWENIVGVVLSERFPALAAIGLLELPDTPIATDTLLLKFLQSQEILVDGETVGDRELLQKGLLEMASIVRQTRLLRRHIAEAAFVLVSGGSEIIGGHKQVLRQVHGLLNTAEAAKKLERSFAQFGDREKHKTELGGRLIKLLDELPPDSDKSQILALFSRVLRDPSFSLEQLQSIIDSTNPMIRYDEIRVDMNIDSLRRRYSRGRKGELTPTEGTLIHNLGSLAYLPEDRLRRIATTVHRVNTVVEATNFWLAELKSEYANLLEGGVNKELIDGLITQLESGQSNLLVTTSYAVAERSAQNLSSLIVEGKRKITVLLGIKKVGSIADVVYGDELKTGQGPIVRNNIIISILKEVGGGDEDKIREALETLKNLDPDLQLQVLRGNMRLKVAQQRQGAKSVLKRETNMEGECSVNVVMSPVVNIVDREETSVVLSSHGLDADVSAGESVEILDKAEQVRVEQNNQDLSDGARNLTRVLDMIDLDVDDIKPDVMDETRSLLRKLGRYILGHPDIVRAIEEYPTLLQQISDLRTAQVVKEQADITLQTRTSI
jgi:hypothetical protein